ncbi:uncharacterized protein METZ01_LOCUS262359 [marine metagenome]|uniref:Uncharacterized protein n=1 Tax=marine metagenome TaxID=408172 RepID=A0A382JD29_9ZZZZ
MHLVATALTFQQDMPMLQDPSKLGVTPQFR